MYRYIYIYVQVYTYTYIYAYLRMPRVIDNISTPKPPNSKLHSKVATPNPVVDLKPLRDQGSGFKVLGLGCRVWGLGFRVYKFKL